MAVDLSGFVNVSGRPIAFDMQSPSFKAKPRPKSDAPKSFHRGWVVEGHRAEDVAEAELLTAQEFARWTAMPDEQKTAAIAEGRRQPAAWDRAKWLATHKPKKLRNRPFEVPEAAEQFAAMCRDAGYINVSVVEVKAGQVQGELA